MSRRFVIILGTAVFVVAVGGGLLLRRALQKAPESLQLGLSPEFTHRQITTELRPFIDYLQQKLERRLTIVVDRDYDTLRLQLLRGEIDLAALPHMQVVHARQAPAAPAMIAAMSYRGSTTYRSVIVVRDNGGLTTLGALRGRRFCFVSHGSASGFLVPRLFLRDRGFDPTRFFSSVRISGSHPQALQDVLANRCDGAATTEGWLQLAAKRGIATARLRVLEVAGRIPLDTLCASSKLPAPVRDRLRRALLQFRARRDIGRPAIGPHFLVDGFARPRWSDFGTLVRAMRAERILPPH